MCYREWAVAESQAHSVSPGLTQAQPGDRSTFILSLWPRVWEAVHTSSYRSCVGKSHVVVKGLPRAVRPQESRLTSLSIISLFTMWESWYLLFVARQISRSDEMLWNVQDKVRHKISSSQSRITLSPGRKMQLRGVIIATNLKKCH